MPSTPDEWLPTRTSLLRRLKRWEDQESWRDFFDTYWRLIYSAAVKAGLNDAEAQDVVQDTVIAVAKKMEDFKYDPAVDSFKGWLLYLTRKRIALHYRKRERDRGGPSRESAFGTPGELERLPDAVATDFEHLERGMGTEFGRRCPGPSQTADQPKAVSNFQFLRPKRMARERGRQNARGERDADLPGEAPDLRGR